MGRLGQAKVLVEIARRLMVESKSARQKHIQAGRPPDASCTQHCYLIRSHRSSIRQSATAFTSALNQTIRRSIFWNRERRPSCLPPQDIFSHHPSFQRVLHSHFSSNIASSATFRACLHGHHDPCCEGRLRTRVRIHLRPR